MGHNFRDPEVSQLDKQLPSKNSRNLYPNVVDLNSLWLQKR